jgi:hypothetical protein
MNPSAHPSGRTIGFVGNPAGLAKDSKDNTGNIIHGFAARTIFAAPVNVRTRTEPGNLEEIRANCRVLGYVGATCLNVNKVPHFIEGHVNAADFVEKLGLPVCVFGLGSQAPLGQSLAEAEVDARSVRLLRVLAEHSAVVAVRGEFTAELCRKLGVHNVAVVGCQSTYVVGLRNRERSLAVPAAPKKPVANLSLGPNEGALLALAMREGADLIGQGNPVEEGIALGRIDRESFVANAHGGFSWPFLEKLFAKGKLDRGAYFDYVRKHFFKFYTVSEWRNHMKRYDFCFGTRFHGNMAALLAGVPALWLAHDMRTDELCRHLRLPVMPHADLKDVAGVDELAARTDYGPFRAAFPARLAEFRDYLEKNGVTDLLKPEFRAESAAVIAEAA